MSKCWVNQGQNSDTGEGGIKKGQKKSDVFYERPLTQLPKLTVHTYSAQQFQSAIHYIQNKYGGEGEGRGRQVSNYPFVPTALPAKSIDRITSALPDVRDDKWKSAR